MAGPVDGVRVLVLTPGARGRVPARPGEHTADVLAGVLGMSDAEIGALVAEAVVA